MDEQIEVEMQKNEYVEYYFQHIHFGEELRIRDVEMIAEQKGQGAEYISCSHDCNDEDYKEGYVTLYFWKPAVSEDVIIHIDNLTFYNKLVEVCEKDIEKYPEHSFFLNECLEKIKRDLYL